MAIVPNLSARISGMSTILQIQTDNKIEHSRPNIVVFKKESKSCGIIDVASRFDPRVIEKEREKVSKYEELKWELKRIRNCDSISNRSA